MRMQTEVSLVSSLPHLFHPTILNACGISVDGQESTLHKVVGFRRTYKEENFFDCGEGWLPIIMAFTQCLDHFLSDNEIVNSKDETGAVKSTVYITGALSHNNRLCMVVDMPGNLDAMIFSKIRAMQEFADAMSGSICETCSTPVVRFDLHGPVRCTVCRCRQTV